MANDSTPRIADVSTRLEAARQLGLETAPVHVARGLTDAQARAAGQGGEILCIVT